MKDKERFEVKTLLPVTDNKVVEVLGEKKTVGVNEVWKERPELEETRYKREKHSHV